MHDQLTSSTTEAERLLVEILAALRSYSETDFRISLTLQNLIRVYLRQGRYDKAVETGEMARELVLREALTEPKEIIRTYNNLAVAYRCAGKMELSEQAFATAWESLKTHVDSAPDGELLEALIRFNRGVLFTGRQRFSEAEEDFRTSLQLHQERLGPHDLYVGDLANNLGAVAYFQRRFDEAEKLLQRALSVWAAIVGGGDLRPMIAQCNLSALYRLQGRFAEAEWFLQRALKIRDEQLLQRPLFQEAFFKNAGDTPHPSWRPWLPEVGLLHPANAYDEPIAIDMPDATEQLPRYREEVRTLRSDSNSQKVQETVKKFGPWYHNLEIRPGLFTNPAIGDHPAGRWRVLEPFVPADLSGKSVLDIGCNAGYFSLQMKRRGAARVVGVDVASDVLSQARFMSVWEDLPIELREIDTYDIEKLGTFDYVAFVGVLYHLKHPLYALEKVSKVCKDTLLFQSVIRGPSGDFDPRKDYPNTEAEIFDLPEYPKLYFIEESFNGDVSNWWFATQSCLKAMLRTVGFREIVSTASPDTFVCRK